MALVLSFSATERNDNKLLTIVDTAGVYDAVTNDDGWGAPNDAVTDIDGVNHTLTMDITVTVSDGTATTYDQIDLYTLFGPFADVTDLSFALDCSMLSSGGEALGTSDDEFPDGLYAITYTFDDGLGTEITTTSTILLDGSVANDLYELLRTMPTDYLCKQCYDKKIFDIVFAKMYLDAIHASAYSARTTSILNQLIVVENLLRNVSNYTW